MVELTGLLLPAAYIVWTLAVQHRRSRQMPASIRMSAVIALVILCTATAAATELLSLVHLVSFWPVLFFWLLAIATGLPWARRGWPQTEIRLARMNPQSRTQWILCSLVLLILLIIFLISRFYPPQTFDTFSYHLPREVMWWQQASVAPFDSSKYRNLSMPPFSEYVGLHLMTLTDGSDLWHTSVQWGFLVVGLCAVTLIVRRCGGSRSSQWLAALFVVTFPAVYYEASSAKNDIIVAVFLSAIVALIVTDVRGVMPYRNALLIGLALGLGLLTKGSMYVLGAPIIIWLCWRLWRRTGVRAGGRILLIVGIAAVLNTGYWARNCAVFGRPLGPPEGADPGVIIANQSHTPLKIFSVAVRNIAWLNLTPFDSVNRPTYRAVARIHDVIGVSLADPDTSFKSPFHLEAIWFQLEECMTSPIHTIVLIAGLAGICIFFRRRPTVVALALCIISGFLLFCAYLTWQEFHIRLLIPYVFLAAVVVALAIPSRGRIGIVLALIVAVLLPIAMVPTQMIGPRSVIARDTWLKSRNELRVGNGREIVTSNANTLAAYVAKLDSVRVVGISESTTDNPTYLLMRPLLDNCGTSIRFEFINPAVRISPSLQTPDVIIGDNENPRVADPRIAPRYAAVKTVPPYTLYQPEQHPDLRGIPLIVQGEITEVLPTQWPGVTAAQLKVESVLRGPADLKNISVASFTIGYLSASDQMLTRCSKGRRGIWLLRPSEFQNLWLMQNGQYLWPDESRPEIEKALAAQ